MRRRTLVLLVPGRALASRAASAQSPSRTVSVLYAGSLVNVMEHGIGRAFDASGSGRFQGYAGGSIGLANQIKGKLRRGDVFISANPAVNNDLMGAANGGWVSWYINFAQSPLVIGYDPASKFASDLKTKPWYEVLQEPGIRIGRTDAKLDPKGKLTLDLLAKAAEALHQPYLPQKVLGAPDNPAQAFPEETLVGRLQSGQLDAAFFYSTETSDLHIPAIALPTEMTLSARYTVTILRDAANPAGAERFVAFLLGPDGARIMRDHGLTVTPPMLVGDAAQVPPALRTLTAAPK